MAEFVRGGPSVSNSAKVCTSIIHLTLIIRHCALAKRYRLPDNDRGILMHYKQTGNIKCQRYRRIISRYWYIGHFLFVYRNICYTWRNVIFIYCRIYRKSFPEHFAA